jgi:uncharacterized membrane protein
MPLEQTKKRNIALAVLYLSGLLIVPLTRFVSEDAGTLIVLVSTVIIITAAYFVYRYASSQKKLLLLLIPGILLLLAFVTFLWERL